MFITSNINTIQTFGKLIAGFTANCDWILESTEGAACRPFDCPAAQLPYIPTASRPGRDLVTF